MIIERLVENIQQKSKVKTLYYIKIKKKKYEIRKEKVVIEGKKNH